MKLTAGNLFTRQLLAKLNRALFRLPPGAMAQELYGANMKTVLTIGRHLAYFLKQLVSCIKINIVPGRSGRINSIKKHVLRSDSGIFYKQTNTMG